ncbi:uncharacterized protein L3040_005364 [Drepanopeziza brunnea f. sp. 'multigermtubi']|uniref:uncharacterized protein n=1 Tax=Drepanopeziza brunnea f. sp. 'multigermtubi' TaxID=698441 RepID=UPI0023A0752D|nr:hypothetical protein L3040_005364 [Drepanopeziza brunnea f. sp. 'multigermtubi']
MPPFKFPAVSRRGGRESDGEDVSNESNEVDSKATPTDKCASARENSLMSLGLLELLDIDDRPVLVLDLASPTKRVPIYHNASLQRIPLLELKVGDGVLCAEASARDPDYAAFLDWATAPHQKELPHIIYCGLWWTAKTIRNRWRIVTGAEAGGHDYTGAKRRLSEAHRVARAQSASSPRPSHSPSQSRSKLTSDESLEAQISAFRMREVAPTQSFPTHDNVEKPKVAIPEHRLDFIKAYPAVIPSPHLQFFMEFDWGSTGVGPISSWSTNLRQMVNILMTDPRPAAMYCGRDKTMMYNEAYVRVTGQKHPGMMGRRFTEAWAEVASDFTEAFEKAYINGQSYVVDDARFYIERHPGYLEETYFSFCIIPFLVDGGEMAFYNPVFDTTRQFIADRRMACLLRFGQYVNASRDQKEFWQQVTIAFRADHTDLPFALIYSVDGDFNDTISEASDQSHESRKWVLEGKIRIPDSCSNIPDRSTEQQMEDFLPGFPELIRAESPTLLLAGNGTMPEFIARNITLADNEPAQSAIFLPIRSIGDNEFGFMIIATSLASAVLFEEEIRRAARDRNLLTKKLAIQTCEALENETRFRRMADLAPVGMFHIDPAGVLLYANENYYEITAHPRNVVTPMSWLCVLADEDLPQMATEWSKLLQGESVNLELRLRRQFNAEELVDGERVDGNRWILAAAYPERATDGTVIGILGCITDISRQKWMEGFRTRKMLEAVELKRQQENFIDMTSHEMRNPLSAIVQCADWIGTSLSKFDCDEADVVIPRDVIDGYADATETIVLCAQHQKRIIDDVLTLSKLDSDLLDITPVDVQPVSMIQASLKMFDFEVQSGDIDFKFQVLPCYTALAVDWVKLDPSRLLQVLINLVTNAIKFTVNEAKRQIVISLGASLTLPDCNQIEYLPRTINRRDMTGGSAWGDGEPVYLYIEVQDSGRGLDSTERNLLFKRFSQASPKTHVQYGGSGLGLFICRQLAELQGGQIGVASSVGVGSKFAFYVRARRCSPPPASPSTQIVNRPRPTGLEAARNPGSEAPKQDSALPTPTPRHVLVVEDNIVNQKVLSRQLQSVGCLVSVANHGKEALSFLEKSRFWKGNEFRGIELSVVLMDLEMPVMDGLTCVKHIRQLQKEGLIVGHVPVIAVTANARSEQISTAKESGMDSVVTKPFRIPDLLPEIDKQVLLGNARTIERSASAPV